jgi:hypothetical protein
MPATTASVCELLLWARANGFHIRELEADGVSIVVDDMRIGIAEPQPNEPASIHGQWAKKLGVNLPVDPEDDDDPEFAVPS